MTHVTFGFSSLQVDADYLLLSEPIVSVTDSWTECNHFTSFITLASLFDYYVTYFYFTDQKHYCRSQDSGSTGKPLELACYELVLLDPKQFIAAVILP